MKLFSKQWGELSTKPLLSWSWSRSFGYLSWPLFWYFVSFNEDFILCIWLGVNAEENCGPPPEYSNWIHWYHWYLGAPRRRPPSV